MHLFLQLLLPILASSLLLFFFTKTRKNGKRKHPKPPGPPGLPIIGNLHQYVSSCPHIYFHELSKTYGPLMSFKLGFVPTLVVSSAKMAKQVLKTHDHIFCNRPKFANQQKLSFNGLSITFSPYGDYWRNIRKLCAVHLLSSKMVQSFSAIREDEVFLMMQRISSLSEVNKLVDLSEMMMCLVNTLICRIAFGRNEDCNDNYKSRTRVMLREIQEQAVSFCLSDCFPFMGWFDKMKGLSCDKVFMELDSLLEEVIEEHDKTIRPKSGPEDIVDVLIKLQKDNSLGFVISREQIKGILMDVFVAGTDTSAATIVWAMTELMKNPKAMAKVQEETRTLMSNNNNTTKMIKEEDLGKLVYLKAVVKETMRLHPVAPLLVPREANQSCIIEGYEIQEKTIVFVNAWAIGRDPESWENPEEFKPERFLYCDKPIDFGGQDFEFIPFGSGRRICPGMLMGVAMVELALANLIYSFDWVVPIGMEKDVMDMNSLPGVTTHKKIPLCLFAKHST